MGKKDRKYKKEDKEKIKRLLATQKELDEQNKEILARARTESTSKHLFTDLNHYLVKQNKKLKREVPLERHEASSDSDAEPIEQLTPIEQPPAAPKINLFSMKKFEATETQKQTNVGLNKVENDDTQRESRKIDHMEKFSSFDPFKNAQDFLEESSSEESEKVEEDAIQQPAEDHDAHLKKFITTYDPVLLKLAELESAKTFQLNSRTLRQSSSESNCHPQAQISNMKEDCPQTKKDAVLPIVEAEFEIIEAIKQNLVTVVCGSTGSGKSTQLPRMLCEAGFLKYGSIGVTQPRRIAAISLASRVANETETELGKEVGFQVRFEAQFTSEETKIKFMTDGILLNELMNDFLLTKYSVIIIDEAHERKLATDVLIGILSRVVKIRSKMALNSFEETAVGSRPKTCPLRLVIMSATLKIEDFTENKAIFPIPPPVISVEAKRFPVFTYYNKETQEDYLTEALEKVRKIHANLPSGGVLVFLTGREEVLNFCRKLYNELKYIRKLKPRTAVGEGEENEEMGNLDSIPIENADDLELSRDLTEDDGQSSIEEDDDEDSGKLKFEHETFIILPLFSKLPVKMQERIFMQSQEKRIIVVSTNVAETSLTINGLKYVVDCGKEKNKYIDPRTGLEQFKVEWITQSSAEQRAGRAGRTQVGYCYRLYTPAVYSKLDKHKPPEITRLPLNYTILQMVKIGIKNVLNFPYPTPPTTERLIQSIKELEDLDGIKVLNEKYDLRITELGEALSYIPLEPRYSKIILQCKKAGLLYNGLLLSGALIADELFVVEGELNIQSRNAIAEFKQQYKKFINSNSDLLTISNIFGEFFKGKQIRNLFGATANLKSKLNDELAKFCAENKIAMKPFAEATAFVFQILQILSLMFDRECVDNLFVSLQDKSELDFREENVLIEIIVSNFIQNVAKKLITCDENNRQRVRYETLDYKSAKLFYKSFINHSGQFFVYKNVFQIGR